MNYNEACDVLGISIKNTNEMILSHGKRAYYKLALKHHPDKGGEPEKFKKINEAWNVVRSRHHMKFDDANNDIKYSDLIKKMVNWMSPGTFDNLFIDTSILSILKNVEGMTFIMLEQMNLKKALKAYELLKKYQLVFGIETHVLEKMEKIIQRKMTNDNIYILNPSLSDILNDRIYKLEIDGLENDIYFPLWHRKKMMEHPDQSNNILIVSEPDLSDNFFISKNNDLFVTTNININELFSNEVLDINIGDNEFKINSKDVCLTKETQIKKYQNCGILKINKDNMFDQSKRSDVYIEITLVN
tara:strand:+ start:16123 stop:17025 length:903 start_codon:yes stop_codon:yes gene_type:complete